MPNREYIGVPLTQSLSIGTKYYLSAYISYADSSFPGWGKCATNNFGFKFTSTAYSNSNPAPTDNNSHFHSSSVIYDSIGWFKISGSFIADSSYSYCMIGNFYDNLNTNNAGCLYYNQTMAYYYVDNVCISTDSVFCDLSTNIKNLNDIFKAEVYPNPSSGNIFIKVPNKSNIIKANFYNSFGEIISTTISGGPSMPREVRYFLF